MDLVTLFSLITMEVGINVKVGIDVEGWDVLGKTST